MSRLCTWSSITTYSEDRLDRLSQDCLHLIKTLVDRVMRIASDQYRTIYGSFELSKPIIDVVIDVRDVSHHSLIKYVVVDLVSVVIKTELIPSR